MMFLDQIFYGNTVQNWLISAVIIFGMLLVNKLIAVLVTKTGKRIATKSNTKLNEIFLDAFLKPFLYGLTLLAIWVALKRLVLPDNFHNALGKAYSILTTLNITWFFTRLLGALITEYFSGGFVKKEHVVRDMRLMPLFRRTVLILMWFFGIFTALNNVGIQLTALLSALGVGGLAAALAAQDTVKNIFGGVTILLDKSFRIGDVIKIDPYEGTVEDIGLRSTKLRLPDKRQVVIPNAKMIDAMILNISAEPERRILMELGLTYDTPPEKMRLAMQILQDIATQNTDVSKKDTVVAFSAFTDSALIIKFIYYLKKGTNVNLVPSAVNMEILERFNAVGLNFAFPTQTLYISK